MPPSPKQKTSWSKSVPNVAPENYEIIQITCSLYIQHTMMKQGQAKMSKLKRRKLEAHKSNGFITIQKYRLENIARPSYSGVENVPLINRSSIFPVCRPSFCFPCNIPYHHPSLAISRKKKGEYVLPVIRVCLVRFLPGQICGQWANVFFNL